MAESRRGEVRMETTGKKASRAGAGGVASIACIVRENIRALIGVGLYCSFTTFAVQYPMHVPGEVRTAVDQMLPFSVVPTAVYALSFLAMALMFAAYRFVPKGRGYVRAVAAAASLGILMTLATYAMPPGLGALGAGLALFGSLLTGVGTALLGIEWMRALAARGALVTLVCMAVSSLLVAALFLLVSLLPQPAVLVVALLVPWGSLACLGYPTSRKAALLRHGVSTPVRVPWKVVLTLFVQGLAAGIVQTLAEGEASWGYLPMQSIALVVAAGLALAAALGLKLDFNQLIYEVGFPLMALGFLALSAASTNSGLGLTIHEVGNRFIMLLSWALAAWIIAQEDLSANWVYPCIMVSYLVGRQVGVVTGLLSGPFAEVLPAAMIFIVLMASVVMLGGFGGRAGWGAFRMADTDAAPVEEDPLEAACQVVAKNYQLTPRETEICHLLARGRNRSYICEACVISSDTAKSHMRNIYRKIGVHSQQELMSLVEEVRDADVDTVAPAVPSVLLSARE